MEQRLVEIYISQGLPTSMNIELCNCLLHFAWNASYVVAVAWIHVSCSKSTSENVKLNNNTY
jgi:hypothetical protein